VERGVRDERTPRFPVAAPVAQFALVGVLALAIVALATYVASSRIGEREAIADARTTALVRAQSRVEPVVTDGLLSGDPAAVAAVDRVVRASVLDRSLVRVKLWTGDGTIVYSDEPRLVGDRYPLEADERTALAAGRIEAGVSDLSARENRFERDQGKLLEVYLPVRTPSGERLLFEAYFRYGTVTSSGDRIWRSFAPITLGALVVLELIQIPIAWSLARRLRDRQREREALLRKALDASDAERRRIAGDLHDGVVQDLAGVAYSLAGAARQPSLPPDTAASLERSASDVRASIRGLRSLLTEIYPPDLAAEGLASALADLLTGVEARGLTTELRYGLPGPGPSPATAALLYRSGQEALRNVVSHARASRVTVTVAANGTGTVLEVADDGAGFDPAVLATSATHGHVGLRGVTDLVRGTGGDIEVLSAPGSGTTVRVTVPS